MQESSIHASSIAAAIGSNFERKPKPWREIVPHESWGDLKIEYQTGLFKLLICFAEPLREDLDLNDLLTIPACRGARKPDSLYSLALNRYNKLVLSTSEHALRQVQAALQQRPDALTGSASSAVTSAIVSGRFTGEFLSRAIEVDIGGLANGAYTRCRFGQGAVIVHRDEDRLWLHWPETMTEYVSNWMNAVLDLQRT